MSAVGADGTRLTGTIASNAQGPTHTGLYAAWIKATSSPGSFNNAMQLLPSSEGSYALLGLTTSSGEKGAGSCQWGASGGNSATQSTTITQNVWQHHAVFFVADVAFPAIYHYFNGTRVDSGASSAVTATQALDRLTLLDGGNLNAFSHLKGRLAEACGFRGLNLTQADAMVAELQTLTPDAVSVPGGVVVPFYYPLLGDATPHTGPTLTNTGSVTFDAGDHPTLSPGGGGGGGSPPEGGIVKSVQRLGRGIGRGLGRGMS